MIYEKVFFVEGLNYNFLSVAQLNKSRYKVEFNQKNALIYNSKGELSGSGEKTKGNLFYLDESIKTCVMVKHALIYVNQ